jgi:hypothetical protein
MTARIYKPARTAMQSGRGKTHEWILVFDPSQAKRQDPLMGWAGWGSTREQIQLRFPTREAALAYCQKYAIDHVVEPPQGSTLKLKAYADNFRYDRVR